MTRNVFATAIVCLVLLICSNALHAQIDTGSLVGTVKDTTGAVIPGATVILTNSATGVATNGTSTSTGQYLFTAIPPGTYMLKVEHSGFAPYVASGIGIHVQVRPTVNVVLSPGTVEQKVTVAAGVPLMQTQSASVGQTVSGHQINTLPLNGRDWTTLGQVAAGVTTVAGGNTSSAYYSVNGQSFNQNDFRMNGIDDNIEMFPSSVHSNNASVVPPPDALSEFKLQNGDFNAEFGHSVGGIINAVIKSGTNTLHGDLWEYLRNNYFDANDYFSNLNHVPIPEYRQSQFGGTVGGPVVVPHIYNGRNRSFFFFDYQGTRTIQPRNSTSTVPTARMRSSNFTNLGDLIADNSGTRTDGLGRTFPLGTVFDPTTTRTIAPGATDPISGFQNTTSSPVSVRDPFFTGGSVYGINNFTGLTSDLNQLPSSRLDSNAIALLKLYPSPTKPGMSNNYYQAARSTHNINSYDVRIDQQLGTKDSIFGVFSRNTSTEFIPNQLPGIADGGAYQNGYTQYPLWELAFGYHHIFSASLSNDFHGGYNHTYENLNSAEADMLNVPAKYGIQGVPQGPGNGGLPLISISGFSNIGVDGYTPTDHTLTSLALDDNLSWIHGNHDVETGVQVTSIGGTALQPVYPRGDFSFDGKYSSIPNLNAGLTGISDMLLIPTASTVGGPNNLGGLSYFAGSVISTAKYHRYYTAAYLQDNWRAMQNLTLNLGVRWDLFTPQTEINGHMANFVATNGNGPGGTYYLPQKTCNYPRSSTFNQLLAKDDIAVKCINNPALGTPQHLNFAPRLGFAYGVTPRLVVRGGYGIAYGALGALGTSETLGQNYPFEYTESYTGPSPIAPLQLSNGQTATMEQALNVTDIANPATASGAGASLIGRQFHLQTGYTETANLTLQYALTRRSTIQAGYVGTFGRHLDISVPTNAATVIEPPGANIYNYIPFPDFSPNSDLEATSGASSYNSLQVVYQLHFVSGDSIIANYTYSKCMQDANQFQAGVGYRAPWLPGFGIGGDMQLCGSDATNVLHIAGTYNLPFGRGRYLWGNATHAVNEIIGGWQIGFIYTNQSGNPFTVGCPIKTTAFFGCNADVVPGVNMYAGPHDQKQWLNPAAFTNPPVATANGTNGFAVLGGEAGQARGPSYQNLDASLIRRFKIVGPTSLEFRAEAFNAFNRAQFGNPGHLNFTNKTNFSEITGLRGNPRLVQFALKLFY